MSFTIANWSCVSNSLSQGQNTVTPFMGSSTVENSPNLFTYGSPNDTVSTISDDNYFLSQYKSISAGDIIIGFGTDSNFIFQVTESNATAVMVEPFASGGGGSGTVTSITANNGILATPSPITTTGNLALNNITAALGKSGVGYYNVMDFGAACNGSTDDTAAIQNCVNVAISNSVSAICIPGPCAISSAITVSNQISFFGIANAHCGLFQNTTTANCLTYTGGGAGGSFSSVTIRDLAFYYFSGSTSASVAISLSASSESFYLYNLNFYGAYTAIESAAGASNIQIDKVFINNGTNGIILNANGSTVSNSLIENLSNNGIVVNGSTINIYSCSLAGVANISISSVAGSQYVNIALCNIQGGAIGILLDAELCSISKCVVLGFTTACIQIQNTIDADDGDSSIEGCIFTGSIGVLQYSSGGLRILNNKFLTNAGYFLSLRGKTGDLFINGNSFENNTTTGINLVLDASFPSSPSTGGNSFGNTNINNNECQMGTDGSPAININLTTSGYINKLLTISNNNIINAFNNASGTAITLTGVEVFTISGNSFDVFEGGTVIPWNIDSTSSSGYISGNAYGSTLSPGINNSTTTKTITSGTATMASGSVIVTNTLVNSGSIIIPASQSAGVTGALSAHTIIPGTSFTITSSVGGDAGLVGYVIQ